MIAVRRIAAATMLAALAGLSAPSAYAAAPATDDAPFLKAIHQGNLAEIAAGRSARKNAKAACVKSAGATLVRDHSKLDVGVKALASTLHVTLSPSPSSVQEKAMTAMQANVGTSAYDTNWLTTETRTREETLALIDRETATGGNAEVKSAARAARPVVAKHLELIRACEARTKRS
ncbi:DUF4142 domain-containing protein [Streptomyces scopuliridis]|uniref:DUF4142 domain-containing protein n=1 Tax=Streptomyces scopuliridis TaxID=452529 RepID=A0ACD4ZDM4_9ACTN|nr:DUF4142 domain-containing protein [Streptomyces scopuliridis]WSB96572.1 DUF4142 domain-containing protein [Streptomyces scopuliridis]WSC09724.1 DUF4142 domain-containing protein [Streptomyces scopuliridis]